MLPLSVLMVTATAVAAGREVLSMVVTTTLLQLLTTIQAAMLRAMATLRCTAEAVIAC
jgi:hypothetical protein